MQIDRILNTNPDIVRIGYIGSYARGDWGVGSDLDMIIVMKETDKPFMQRTLNLEYSKLPVPVEILVYSIQEWESLSQKGGKFFNTVQNEVVWIYQNPEIILG
jgi:predicted nucleotidyltransferase